MKNGSGSVGILPQAIGVVPVTWFGPGESTYEFAGLIGLMHNDGGVLTIDPVDFRRELFQAGTLLQQPVPIVCTPDRLSNLSESYAFGSEIEAARQLLQEFLPLRRELPTLTQNPCAIVNPLLKLVRFFADQKRPDLFQKCRKFDEDLFFIEQMIAQLIEDSRSGEARKRHNYSELSIVCRYLSTI